MPIQPNLVAVLDRLRGQPEELCLSYSLDEYKNCEHLTRGLRTAGVTRPRLLRGAPALLRGRFDSSMTRSFPSLTYMVANCISKLAQRRLGATSSTATFGSTSNLRVQSSDGPLYILSKYRRCDLRTLPTRRENLILAERQMAGDTRTMKIDREIFLTLAATLAGCGGAADPVPLAQAPQVAVKAVIELPPGGGRWATFEELSKADLSTIKFVLGQSGHSAGTRFLIQIRDGVVVGPTGPEWERIQAAAARSTTARETIAERPAPRKREPMEGTPKDAASYVPGDLCGMKYRGLGDELIMPAQNNVDVIRFSRGTAGYAALEQALGKVPKYLFAKELVSRLNGMYDVTDGQVFELYEIYQGTSVCEKGAPQRVTFGSSDWKGLVAEYKIDEAHMRSHDPAKPSCQDAYKGPSPSCGGCAKADAKYCRVALQVLIPAVFNQTVVTLGRNKCVGRGDANSVSCRDKTNAAVDACARLKQKCPQTRTDCETALSRYSKAGIAKIEACASKCNGDGADCEYDLFPTGE